MWRRDLAGIGMSVGSSLLVTPGADWTPALLGPKWFAPPLNNLYVTEAAPATLVNGTFDTDTDWTKEAGWTISSGKAHVSTASTPRIYQQGGLISGNRYSLNWEITDYTSGIIQIRIGSSHSGDYRSATGIYSEENTCEGTAYLYFRAAPAVASIDNVETVINHSISSINPHSSSTLTGSFANATATEQPWIDTTTSWIRFDGTADDAAYDGAAADFKFLHYSATAAGNYPEFTFVIPVTATALSAAKIFYEADPGLQVSITAAGVIEALVRNAVPATIATATTAAGCLSAGVSAILMIVADAVNLKIYIDGIEVASGAFSGTPSSANPGSAPVLASTGSASFLTGTIVPPLALDYAVDANQRAAIFAYYAKELA